MGESTSIDCKCLQISEPCRIIRRKKNSPSPAMGDGEALQRGALKNTAQHEQEPKNQQGDTQRRGDQGDGQYQTNPHEDHP